LKITYQELNTTNVPVFITHWLLPWRQRQQVANLWNVHNCTLLDIRWQVLQFLLGHAWYQIWYSTTVLLHCKQIFANSPSSSNIFLNRQSTNHFTATEPTKATTHILTQCYNIASPKQSTNHFTAIEPTKATTHILTQCYNIASPKQSNNHFTATEPTKATTHILTQCYNIASPTQSNNHFTATEPTKATTHILTQCYNTASPKQSTNHSLLLNPKKL